MKIIIIIHFHLPYINFEWKKSNVLKLLINTNFSLSDDNIKLLNDYLLSSTENEHDLFIINKLININS